MIFILVTLLHCTPEPPHIPDCKMEFPFEDFQLLVDKHYGCYVEFFNGGIIQVSETCGAIIEQGKFKTNAPKKETKLNYQDVNL